MAIRGLWTALVLLIAGSCFFPTTAICKVRILSGHVTYRERMALPRSAVIEVRLVDVSRADGRAVTIAATSIKPQAAAPFPYQLRYDDSMIQSGNAYVLEARIIINGTLRFISAEQTRVLTWLPDRTEITVQKIDRQKGTPLATTAGRWLAEDIHGGGVIDQPHPVLELGAGGDLSGTGGCNRITGRAKIVRDTIRIGLIAVTKKTCTPAVMNQESRFVAALRAATRWKIDPATHKLFLMDEVGRTVVMLSQISREVRQ
jgi:putative lipoprotein